MQEINMEQKKDKYLRVRLSPSIHKKLKLLCTNADKSFQKYIEELISEWVKDKEKEMKNA